MSSSLRRAPGSLSELALSTFRGPVYWTLRACTGMLPIKGIYWSPDGTRIGTRQLRRDRDGLARWCRSALFSLREFLVRDRLIGGAGPRSMARAGVPSSRNRRMSHRPRRGGDRPVPGDAPHQLRSGQRRGPAFRRCVDSETQQGTPEDGFSWCREPDGDRRLTGRMASDPGRPTSHPPSTRCGTAARRGTG